MEDKVLLSLQDLSKNFHVNGGTLKAGILHRNS